MPSASSHQQGPPYPPHFSQPGGSPAPIPDVVLSSLFLAFYVGLAIFHQFIYQTNRRRSHNFKISIPLFGFCMARILTQTLRIVWVYKSHNVSLAIAANIFTNAGTLILYVVNLLFAQRIFRARHPVVGWNRPLHFALITCYVLVAPALIMIITLVTLGSYSLNPSIGQDVRKCELAALTYITFFAVLAPALLIAAFAIPKSKKVPMQTFGSGSLTSKVLIAATSSTLCLIIAGYRCGSTWQAPRPLDNPPWWDSKASLYVFLFAMEALVMILFAVTRVDVRFHVPDGSSKRRTYEVPAAADKLTGGPDRDARGAEEEPKEAV